MPGTSSPRVSSPSPSPSDAVDRWDWSRRRRLVHRLACSWHMAAEGCVENGPAAALLVGYVSIQICALLAPCRRPILNATTSPLFARRCTSLLFAFSLSSGANVKERAGSSESRNIRSSGDRCPPWTRSGSSHAKIATNNEIFYTVSRFGSSGRLCDGNPVVAHC
jgi:hypothetical protein